jgi:hypothetical protein
VTDLDLTQLGGQFSGARMGPCRVCRDITVLPAFGDGRCFGCTTDEIGETEWVPQKQIHFHEDEFLLVHKEILEIFDEAQQRVPAYKVVADLSGDNGSVQVRRHSLWLPRNRRWASVVVPSERVEQGQSIRSAMSGYLRDLRKAHLAAGLCGQCVSPALPGLSLCEKHMAPIRARYLDKKVSGVCLSCGGPRDTDRGTCKACIARHALTQSARAERLSAAGLCTACGKRPGAPRWCRECMDKKNAARRVTAKPDAGGGG